MSKYLNISEYLKIFEFVYISQHYFLFVGIPWRFVRGFIFVGIPVLLRLLCIHQACDGPDRSTGMKSMQQILHQRMNVKLVERAYIAPMLVHTYMAYMEPKMIQTSEKTGKHACPYVE